MGVFLSLDEESRVLYIRFEGIATDDVLLYRYQQVREWVAVHGYFSSISDFSEVTSFEVTSTGVKQLEAHSPLVSDEFLRVVVAPQDIAFGMARMFGILGSNTRRSVEVVHTLAEAYRLFGVELLDLSPIVDW
jgi:hypothetical protein